MTDSINVSVGEELLEDAESLERISDLEGESKALWLWTISYIYLVKTLGSQKKKLYRVLRRFW